MIPKESRTRRITLAASFAAIYFVLRSIPTFQMVGISGRFTAGDFLLTTIAMTAGTWSGSVAVLLGTIAGFASRPPIFLGLDFLPGVANVLVTSLIFTGRLRLARAMYLVVLFAFLISPYSLLFGLGPVPYAWLHMATFLLLLSPVARIIPGWVSASSGRQIAAVALLSLFGTMAQHLTGGILYEITAGWIGNVSPEKFQAFWQVIFWVYPVERIIIVAISTTIALAVYKASNKLNT